VKLNENAVAGGFHNPAAMERNGRVDQLPAEIAETLERAFLVKPGQSGIARYIGGQDGGNRAVCDQGLSNLRTHFSI
jgi:hypothetical protein